MQDARFLAYLQNILQFLTYAKREGGIFMNYDRPCQHDLRCPFRVGDICKKLTWYFNNWHDEHDKPACEE